MLVLSAGAPFILGSTTLFSKVDVKLQSFYLACIYWYESANNLVPCWYYIFRNANFSICVGSFRERDVNGERRMIRHQSSQGLRTVCLLVP